MSLLLHISDTHFGTEQAPVVEALRRLSFQLRPQVVVLSGDITQRARPSQFAAARAFCDSLAVPHLLALPGNHDIPLFDLVTRVADPYRHYRAAFGALEPQLALPDLLVSCVNTTRPRRHKHGEVSREQVERVCDRLRGARREQLRIVVTHQPACVVREEDGKDRLRGGHGAVRAWSLAGADLVLGGHIHLPYIADVRAKVSGTPRALFCLQAGTAVSHRVRYGTPNSVNVVRWSAPPPGAARKCRVERWDYDLADAHFERTHEHELTLAD
ncbi:metallophosphoesterase family protein [Ramlibacter humi]|uniref:Metallophosphoesterase n=1 Tax=Ramlibacter humi TaxID=2530451 RepID=A0A4Z0CC78_9BURK|nr:metallophosphoesterase [Ramlibacter humi]TFZ07990.1 metallophosphoesterase [Ramlibacter humi]